MGKNTGYILIGIALVGLYFTYKTNQTATAAVATGPSPSSVLGWLGL